MKKEACVLLLISVVFCFACGNNVAKRIDNEDAIMDSSTIGKPAKAMSDTLIFGVWWYVGEDLPSANFVIQKDSIFYPENFQSFPYTFSDDSLSITYDSGFCVTSKYKMKGHDTLMILGDDGWGAYIRNSDSSALQTWTSRQ